MKAYLRIASVAMSISFLTGIRADASSHSPQSTCTSLFSKVFTDGSSLEAWDARKTGETEKLERRKSEEIPPPKRFEGIVELNPSATIGSSRLLSSWSPRSGKQTARAWKGASRHVLPFCEPHEVYTPTGAVRAVVLLKGGDILVREKGKRALLDIRGRFAQQTSCWYGTFVDTDKGKFFWVWYQLNNGPCGISADTWPTMAAALSERLDDQTLPVATSVPRGLIFRYQQ
jgi:hypothetical protein